MRCHRSSTAAILVVAVVLLPPTPLRAWGRIGHRVSAMLAESRLSPAAAAAIRNLLQPGETLADISIWADQQRDIPGTGPWHYVNVPITGNDYCEIAVPILRERLARSGVRLAFMLNEIFR